MAVFAHPDQFNHRHMGPRASDAQHMLDELGYESLDAFGKAVVPAAIRLAEAPELPQPGSERRVLDELHAIAETNEVWRSYIGGGYYGTLLPPVIQRMVLENPGWYTQYTPYQAEISQGRLESLVNFQTLVQELSGLPIANASLLDEATALAEAMHLAVGHFRGKRKRIQIADHHHPQNHAVVETRAEPLDLQLDTLPFSELNPDENTACVLVAWPATDGTLEDLTRLAEACAASKTLLVVATDPLACCLLNGPGTVGADIVIGSLQRFGVPLGCGGPHAAFFACKEAYKRLLPGRLVGVSQDAEGGVAYRLALQTREQHIRREKATSNICTAQALLANIAAMYAVYHGGAGLKAIATHVHRATCALAEGLRRLGHLVKEAPFFDTLAVTAARGDANVLHARAAAKRINLRVIDDQHLAISLDETVTDADIQDLLAVFAGTPDHHIDLVSLAATPSPIDAAWLRGDDFLQHPVFHKHTSETAMLRYCKSLENKDLSLTRAMIPLGSCTMKLNAAAEMLALTLPGFANIHPQAPMAQRAGYISLASDLEDWLARLTGFAATSLQPNAGAQGEYAGLLAIRAWHRSRGDEQRDICLIPTSAHGTNPASAAMVGMRVVTVACDDMGNIDVDDLQQKASDNKDRLAAIMVTYPSTHGVFEERILDITQIVHDNGGQVYMDGANMNAQVCLTSPGAIGADVCHLNLHKTFCIPHGGGGPGVGPICVAQHLAPYLPNHRARPDGVGAVSAAPLGSASILTIPWAYIRLMGSQGLKSATEHAMLAANYIAKYLDHAFPILYKAASGLVAHECILDLRPWKQRTGIEAEDVAKRLMDFGFHAPTLSFPVPGTLMVEPTESEPLEELDRFIDAMLSIYAELCAIENGEIERADSPLVHAPHTSKQIAASTWDRKYSREQAAFPRPWLDASKYWPPVARIDNAYGDRHLFCSCAPVETAAEAPEAEVAAV